MEYEMSIYCCPYCGCFLAHTDLLDFNRSGKVFKGLYCLHCGFNRELSSKYYKNSYAASYKFIKEESLKQQISLFDGDFM